MMSVRHEILAASAAIAAALWYPPATWAQSVAQFYSGRSLELDISSSVGGGYDAYARMLARHIGRFIPGNPVVVAKTWKAPAVCGSPTFSIMLRRGTAPPSPRF